MTIGYMITAWRLARELGEILNSMIVSWTISKFLLGLRDSHKSNRNQRKSKRNPRRRSNWRSNWRMHCSSKELAKGKCSQLKRLLPESGFI